jgi:ribosomal protein S18 acetylase RimI-like enzyme
MGVPEEKIGLVLPHQDVRPREGCNVNLIGNWNRAMLDIKVERYRPEYFEGVNSLWREVFPDGPPRDAADVAIPAKLAVQPELFIVALDGGRVVGSIMAGYDGHRGWIYMLAVSNSHRRRHIGSALVQEAQARLAAIGCQKINLQVRTSNAGEVEFYEKLGYTIEERISMGKRV